MMSEEMAEAEERNGSNECDQNSDRQRHNEMERSHGQLEKIRWSKKLKK